MMRFLVVLALALVISTQAAGDEGVQPVWLPAVEVVQGRNYSPDVALDGRGDAVLVWQESLGHTIFARYRAATAPRWGPVATLDPGTVDLTVPSVAIDEAGDAVAAWTSGSPRADAVAWAATRSAADKKWSAAVRLSTRGAYRGPWVVVDGQGNATAAWVRFDRETYSDRLETAYRPVGGGWAFTGEIARASAFTTDARLAGNRAGSVLLAWYASSDPRAGYSVGAVLGRRGTWAGPTTLVAPIYYGFGSAIGEDGTAAVGWSVTEHGNAITTVAIRRPGATDWELPAKVSFEDGQAGPPELAVDGEGTVCAVWGTDPDLESACLIAGSGTWERPVAVSDPGYGDGDVVAGAKGGFMVVYARGSEGRKARTRPAGAGTWSAPVTFAPDKRGAKTLAALDDDGDALAVWQGSTQDGYLSSVYVATLDAAPPAVASLHVPATGRVGKKLRLSASFRDISTTAVRWRLGDGRSASGSTTVHTYRRTGRYRVEITATDAAGHTTSVTQTVTVRR